LLHEKIFIHYAISQFEEVHYYLVGLLGDVEQRHRHTGGDFINRILFPEVPYIIIMYDLNYDILTYY